jgi:hypothetical protein
MPQPRRVEDVNMTARHFSAQMRDIEPYIVFPPQIIVGMDVLSIEMEYV